MGEVVAWLYLIPTELQRPYQGETIAHITSKSDFLLWHIPLYVGWGFGKKWCWMDREGQNQKGRYSWMQAKHAKLNSDHSRLHRENLWQLPVLSRGNLNFRIYDTPQWENLDNTRHKNTNHTDLWMRRWHQCPLPRQHWQRKCSCRSQPSAWCTSWAPWAGTSHDSCSRSPRSGFLHHHIVNRFRNLTGLFLQTQMPTSPFCMWIHTEDLCRVCPVFWLEKSVGKCKA